MLLGIEQYLGYAIIVRIVQLLGYFVFQPNVQSVGILSRLDFFQFLNPVNFKISTYLQPDTAHP